MKPHKQTNLENVDPRLGAEAFPGAFGEMEAGGGDKETNEPDLVDYLEGLRLAGAL